MSSYLVSPSGDRIVYLADQDVAQRFELYTVKTNGRARPVRLNGPLVPGGDVVGSPLLTLVRISPDGERVVYVADQDEDECFELYSVPIDGGTARRLNGPLVPGGDVLALEALDIDSSFQISPDGQRVLYVADQDVDGVRELYSVPIDGYGFPTKLHPSLAAGPCISGFSISPAGGRAVFRLDLDGDALEELFSVPLVGGIEPVLLHPRPGIAGPLGGVEVSSDGTRVAYQAFDLQRNALELLSVPLDGSLEPIRLTGGLPRGRDVRAFRIGSDGRRVVFSSNLDERLAHELFSASITGRGAPLKLHPPLASGRQVTSFALDKGGARAVYLADADRPGVPELFAAPLDGSSAPIKLNRPLSVGARVHPGFAITSDGARVVFRSDEEGDGAFVLFSAPLRLPGPPVLLGAASVSSDSFSLGSFRLSPDGQRVAFQTDLGAEEQLFSRFIDGHGEPVALNGPLASSGNVVFDSQRFSADGRYVLYLADQETDEVVELFGVPVGGGTAVRLNEPLAWPESARVSAHPTVQPSNGTRP